MRQNWGAYIRLTDPCWYVLCYSCNWDFSDGSVVKNLNVMQETTCSSGAVGSFSRDLPHTGTFNEYPGLIFFRIDCFDLLAVQGILKSLLQHHSSKASILQHSAFFIVQLSTTPCTAAIRLFCPSPSPRLCSKSCSLSWCCYLTISSSVAPFSS